MTIKIITDEQPDWYSHTWVNVGGKLYPQPAVKELTSTYDIFESESWERKEVEGYARRHDNVPEFVKYEEFIQEQTLAGYGEFTSYRAVWWEVTVS